jgi:hypothetical protein
MEFSHFGAGVIARRLSGASRLGPGGIGIPSHFAYGARGQGYVMMALRSLAKQTW